MTQAALHARPRPSPRATFIAPAAVAFAVIWGAAALSQFGYQTHGVRLRLSEAISLLVVAAVVLAWRFAVVRPAALLLFGYATVEIFSTLLNRPDWGRGFKLDLILLAEAVIAAIIAYLVGVLDAQTIARTIVGVGTGEAVAAIVFSGLYALHVSSFGVQIDPATNLCKAYGTMWEANLLASFLSGILVFSLAVRSLLGRPWVQAACASLMAVAIGLTLTRAAWIAILIGVVALVVLRFGSRGQVARSELVAWTLPAGLLVAGAAVVLLAANHGVCGHSSAIGSQATSVIGRVTNHELALSEAKHSPIFGSGTGSIQAHVAGDPHQPWISAMAIDSLHDTGVVGSLVVAGLVLLLLWKLYRERVDAPPARQQLINGITAALITLLVAFQATTGMIMEYPWLFAGTAVGLLTSRQRS